VEAQLGLQQFQYLERPAVPLNPPSTYLISGHELC